MREKYGEVEGDKEIKRGRYRERKIKRKMES